MELLCCRTCCRSRLSAAPACTPPLKVAGYGYVCDKLRAGSLPLSSSALRSYLGCVAQLPTVHTAHCGVGLRFAWWQPVGSTASDSSTSLDHCGTTRLSGSSRRSMVGRICTYGQFYVKRDTGLAKRHEVGGDPNCLLLTAWGGGAGNHMSGHSICNLKGMMWGSTSSYFCCHSQRSSSSRRSSSDVGTGRPPELKRELVVENLPVLLGLYSTSWGLMRGRCIIDGSLSGG